jgi:hypothetical protein
MRKHIGIIEATIGALWFLGTVGAVDTSPITFDKALALLASALMAFHGARLIGKDGSL